MEGTVAGCVGRDPTSADATFGAPERLSGVEQQQVPDTRLWMAAFLALALALIAAALAWQAFGPPIK